MKIKSHRGKYELLFKQDDINILYPMTIDNNIILADTNFFIIDENIKKLHQHRLKGIKNVIYITAKEENKSLEYCSSIIEKLIKKNIEKNCVLIAVGGGITQDITLVVARRFNGI